MSATRNYPLNCWYVAATSDEVGRQPLGRRLLDRDVVLYRTQTGEPVALADRCAHRAMPLSAGRLDGDDIVCGYHGFTYDTGGRCVRIPSQPHVPTGTCVSAYPVLEQAPFVWIWLGRPADAAATRPPRTAWLGAPGWGEFATARHVDANLMLLHEHYLDFTHAFELHPTQMPVTPDALPSLDEIEVSETSVSYTRSIPAAPLADWEAEATGLDRSGRYRRNESGRFVSPALHVQRWEIEGDDGEVYANVRVQAFTPESPTSTRVFLRGTHSYAADRAVVTQHLKDMVDGLAQRDFALLERIQAGGGLAAWNTGLHVLADGAALKARGIVDAMLRQEAGRVTIA
jgi:phenylpropionate dioxygenase-like ring-hydroxylating dioxygenase large terminal subunit